MSITIENGIPAPSRPNRGIYDYPFEKLKVGDSFVVEIQGSSWAGVFSQMQVAQRKLDIKLTSRLVEERKRRIWRTA